MTNAFSNRWYRSSINDVLVQHTNHTIKGIVKFGTDSMNLINNT